MVNAHMKLRRLKQDWKTKLLKLEMSVLQSAGKNGKNWSLYIDVINGKVSFIDTTPAPVSTSQMDDHESKNKILVLPEESAESKPKIRIANFAVDQVPKEFLTSNYDEDIATSSTSHLAKPSSSSLQ